MKKLLYGFSLLLLSGSAWTFTPEIQPQKAVKVCARLSPKETRDACYHVIANASFDEGAVGVCDVLKSTDATLNCLKLIKDSPFYNHTSVLMCARYERDSDVSECLDDIAGEYFEDQAVLACNRIKDDIFATDCLDAVAGNTFDPDDIAKCDSLSSDEKTVECFDHAAKGATHEQLESLRKRPSRLVPTLDLRQFINPTAAPNCVPDKQDRNSQVQNQIKDSDDLVRRFLATSKKG
jgi:hypothetical protein